MKERQSIKPVRSIEREELPTRLVDRRKVILLNRTPLATAMPSIVGRDLAAISGPSSAEGSVGVSRLAGVHHRSCARQFLRLPATNGFDENRPPTAGASAIDRIVTELSPPSTGGRLIPGGCRQPRMITGLARQADCWPRREIPQRQLDDMTANTAMPPGEHQVTERLNRIGWVDGDGPWRRIGISAHLSSGTIGERTSGSWTSSSL